MAVWKDGTFIQDSWRHIDEGEDAPPSGRVILPLEWWLSERAIFDQSTAPIGVLLEPDADLALIGADIGRFALIALRFPSFADGRAFSQGASLRETFGFAGDLRATGDVLIDQIPLMIRCGFTSFEIANAATEKALRNNAVPRQRLYYQPAVIPEAPAGTRPWLYRATD